jgi:hypothetical protein
LFESQEKDIVIDMGIKFIFYINLFMIILLFNISENKKFLIFSDDFDDNKLNLNFWEKKSRLDCECLL